MRVRSKRFPPIEKDMKMILAHCGSLFLDPKSLAEVRAQATAPVVVSSAQGRRCLPANGWMRRRGGRLTTSMAPPGFGAGVPRARGAGAPALPNGVQHRDDGGGYLEAGAGAFLAEEVVVGCWLHPCSSDHCAMMGATTQQRR